MEVWLLLVRLKFRIDAVVGPLDDAIVAVVQRVIVHIYVQLIVGVARVHDPHRVVRTAGRTRDFCWEEPSSSFALAFVVSLPAPVPLWSTHALSKASARIDGELIVLRVGVHAVNFAITSLIITVGGHLHGLTAQGLPAVKRVILKLHLFAHLSVFANMGEPDFLLIKKRLVANTQKLNLNTLNKEIILVLKTPKFHLRNK